MTINTQVHLDDGTDPSNTMSGKKMQDKPFSHKNFTYFLLATAPTEDMIMQSIEKFYGGTTFKLLDDGRLERLSDGKIISSTRVIKKGKRWRFEGIRQKHNA